MTWEDIPDVHIALYTESGTLIYGRTRVELAFEQDAVRRVSSGGMEWYALDTLLTFAGRSSVWMRASRRRTRRQRLMSWCCG